jgi:AcrR family transcriptional regulator
MKHAGLTRGGFYSHFRTKSELYAEAVALALAVTPWSRWDGVSVDFAARDCARQVVDAYLSREHFDDVEGTPDGYFAQRCGAERQRRPAQL